MCGKRDADCVTSFTAWFPSQRRTRRARHAFPWREADDVMRMLLLLQRERGCCDARQLTHKSRHTLFDASRSLALTQGVQQRWSLCPSFPSCRRTPVPCSAAAAKSASKFILCFLFCTFLESCLPDLSSRQPPSYFFAQIEVIILPEYLHSVPSQHVAPGMQGIE